jgi:hypothetical protein
MQKKKKRKEKKPNTEREHSFKDDQRSITAKEGGIGLHNF